MQLHEQHVHTHTHLEPIVFPHLYKVVILRPRTSLLLAGDAGIPQPQAQVTLAVDLAKHNHRSYVYGRRVQPRLLVVAPTHTPAFYYYATVQEGMLTSGKAASCSRRTLANKQVGQADSMLCCR